MGYDLNKCLEVFQKPGQRVDAFSASPDLYRANTAASTTLDVAVWRHLCMKTKNQTIRSAECGRLERSMATASNCAVNPSNQRTQHALCHKAAPAQPIFRTRPPLALPATMQTGRRQALASWPSRESTQEPKSKSLQQGREQCER